MTGKIFRTICNFQGSLNSRKRKLFVKYNSNNSLYVLRNDVECVSGNQINKFSNGKRVKPHSCCVLITRKATANGFEMALTAHLCRFNQNNSQRGRRRFDRCRDLPDEYHYEYLRTRIKLPFMIILRLRAQLMIMSQSDRLKRRLMKMKIAVVDMFRRITNRNEAFNNLFMNSTAL